MSLVGKFVLEKRFYSVSKWVSAHSWVYNIHLVKPPAAQLALWFQLDIHGCSFHATGFQHMEP